METSSPLAAMRPPAPMFGQRGLFRSHAHSHLSANPRGSGTLNLREQFGLQRSYQPYSDSFNSFSNSFNVKAVQGSSPAASLAADLSQNFSITDASPHFPTPRRALFTTANMMDAIEGREYYVTTPPLLPSSSPAPTTDMMDVSPLPHKAPFTSYVDMYSPTPVQSPGDYMMLESPALPQMVSPAVPQTASPALPHMASPALPQMTLEPPKLLNLEPPKPVLPERRKAAFRRPSLSRHKGYSTGVMPNRMHVDTQLQSFRFGDDTSHRPSNSSMSLSECFQASPPQERRPQTANSPCATAVTGARAKPQFASLSSMGALRNGSPINGHSRRPSNPFMRPRKQCRRSLSMFENPNDVMKLKKEDTPQATKLQAVMDIEEPPEPVLPHFFAEGKNDCIPRISQGTMLDVLDGKYCDQFTQKMVIDCRFEYEYEGGHINGAINYNDKELLASHLFRTPMQGRTLLIFHCEYSAHRAPIMARHIRAEDRSANAEFYPRLTYPDVYILEGGYSGFFTDHRDRCYPQAYVEMGDAQHVRTCEREMGRLRQNRKGLSRAQTFAFGQKNQSIENSPTAPGRSNNREPLDMMMLGASPILGNDRCHTRRMASY